MLLARADRGEGGIVDGSFLCDFLPVAIVLVRPHSLRSRLCNPARVGRDPFSGAAPARQPSASPRWSGNFSFFFADHVGGCPPRLLHPAPARSLFCQDFADHPGARVSRLDRKSVV